jgi:hypothetical protein
MAHHVTGASVAVEVVRLQMRDRSVMKLVWKLMEWWHKLLIHMLIDHLHA